MKRLMQVLLLVGVVLPAVVLSTGCGGGSDDDNDNSGNNNGGGGLSTDACSVLGLKIINGSTCRESNAPVVLYNVSYSDSPGTSCTGSMITPVDVLTAGHCFINLGRTVTAITVFVGGDQISATDFSIHPDYREASNPNILGGAAIFNDAALIRLSTPAAVPTIPLIVSRGTAVGDIVSIFGYGLDEHGDAGTLQSGEMKLDQVTGDLIISVFNGDGSNTCQGDSGGPALMTVGATAGLVGLTSSGIAQAQCLKGDISVFTNTQSPNVLNYILSLAPDAGQI